MRGFITLPLVAYVALAAVLALTFGVIQTHRLKLAKAEYAAFVSEVKVRGGEQERRTKETIDRQKREANEAEKRSQRALVDIRSKYDRLRESGSYRGLVPPVPETTAILDDRARDSRLLEVLRFAEEQTRQLTELQSWVRANGAGP